MLGRLPSLTLIRLWAALLLATIGLQATLADPPSLEPRSGSAFSASTQEVALSVQRAERVQRQAIAPLPFASLALIAQARLALPAALPVLFAPRPSSTAPPALRDIHSRKSAPRAPPRA